jgi:hypothetical protein
MWAGFGGGKHHRKSARLCRPEAGGRINTSQKMPLVAFKSHMCPVASSGVKTSHFGILRNAAYDTLLADGDSRKGLFPCDRCANVWRHGKPLFPVPPSRLEDELEGNNDNAVGIPACGRSEDPEGARR